MMSFFPGMVTPGKGTQAWLVAMNARGELVTTVLDADGKPTTNFAIAKNAEDFLYWLAREIVGPDGHASVTLLKADDSTCFNLTAGEFKLWSEVVAALNKPAAKRKAFERTGLLVLNSRLQRRWIAAGVWGNQYIVETRGHGRGYETTPLAKRLDAERAAKYPPAEPLTSPAPPDS